MLPRALCLLLLCLCPVLSDAATYYVSASAGDNGNACVDGSQATMKQTINAGAGCLSAGDTLIVKTGVYDEVIADAIPSGISDSQHTIVRAEVQYGAVIRPTTAGALCQTIGIMCINGAYITVDGITTDGSGVFASVYHFYVASPLAHHIVIENSKARYGIDNNTTSNTLGYTELSGAHHITVRNTIVHDVGTGASAGQAFYSYCFYVHANDSLFEGNECVNASGYAFHQYTSLTDFANRNIIRNNIFRNSNPFSGLTGPVLLASSGDDNLFYNNLIYDNNGIGIVVNGYGGDRAYRNKIYNNTLYNNTVGCIRLGADGWWPVDTQIFNNICYGNGNNTITNGLNPGVGTIAPTERHLTTNPLFVHEGARDFRLQAGSPAIDAGENLQAFFTTDFAGNLRGAGAGWDIGAYEFGGPPPPTRVRFVAQPQPASSGALLAPVAVQVQDANGNLASGFSENITLTLATGDTPVPWQQTTLVSVDSANSGEDGFLALDGTTMTFWHTEYTESDPPHPHTLVVNLGASTSIVGVEYTPRQDGGLNGTIGQYEVAVSTNGTTWGSPVASGTWDNTSAPKIVFFGPVVGQYVRLIAHSESQGVGYPWTSVATLTTLAAIPTGGMLQGTLVRPASGGQVAFDDLRLSPPGTYQLRVTAAGLTPDISTSVVISPAAPTHLRFGAQPQTVLVGQTLPPITVEFLDAAEQVFPTTQAVNISLASCPGASLGGTVSRAATAGTATFDDLFVATGGTGCVLQAAAEGMTEATSTPFSLLSGPFVTTAWTARGTAAQLCSRAGGDTNTASVTAGTDYSHSLSCPIPAAFLRAGSTIRACHLLGLVPGTARPVYDLKLFANSIQLVQVHSPFDFGYPAQNAWVCFVLRAGAAPGASVPVVATVDNAYWSGIAAEFLGEPTDSNAIAQPVLLPTEDLLLVTLATRWASAGTGINELHQHAMTMEIAQQ